MRKPRHNWCFLCCLNIKLCTKNKIWLTFFVFLCIYLFTLLRLYLILLNIAIIFTYIRFYVFTFLCLCVKRCVFYCFKPYVGSLRDIQSRMMLISVQIVIRQRVLLLIEAHTQNQTTTFHYDSIQRLNALYAVSLVWS